MVSQPIRPDPDELLKHAQVDEQARQRSDLIQFFLVKLTGGKPRADQKIFYSG